MEVLTPVTATFDEQYDITIPASAFGEDGTVKIKIYAEDGSDFTPLLNQYASVYYSPTDGNEDSYIKNVTLFYESEDIIISDGRHHGNANRPLREAHPPEGKGVQGHPDPGRTEDGLVLLKLRQ